MYAQQQCASALFCIPRNGLAVFLHVNETRHNMNEVFIHIQPTPQSPELKNELLQQQQALIHDLHRAAPEYTPTALSTGRHFLVSA